MNTFKTLLIVLLAVAFLGCNNTSSDAPKEVTYYVNELESENGQITESPTAKTITYVDDEGGQVTEPSDEGVFMQELDINDNHELSLSVDSDNRIYVRLYIYIDNSPAQSFKGYIENEDVTINHSL